MANAAGSAAGSAAAVSSNRRCTINRPNSSAPAGYDGSEIAVVGLACRFPGADDPETYWRNVRDGVCSTHHFRDEELLAAGVPEARLKEPGYVKAAAFLSRPDYFDAAFFDMSHREAEITDPQHRILLELAHHLLEDAGHTAASFPGRIGVFAGATLNSYLVFHLAADTAGISDLEPVQLNIGNGGDFLTTRIAYKLNLQGPCYTVQSACSTSLVAVHVACESLLNAECDMALAGGVSVNVGFRHGYRYVEGGMASPDGFCRPFDARAQGTLFGSGAGLVALRRLEDALADGDSVHAVVRGTAVNNDGSLKVGYTAPSVDGQAKVVREALENAGLKPEDIGYVEAHGTATPLGDPIEVDALTKAWRPDTDRRGFCALGSVKGNLGHLDAAAGIAGFIKTVLAVEHGKLPPSLHFERPNPNIDFAASPFYVNGTLRDWPGGKPRRAAVSAFGVGGTNAHAILEEPPRPPRPAPSLSRHLLPLSAKTEAALGNMAVRLADHLSEHPEVSLADVAYTLKRGRQVFRHRRFVSASTHEEAVAGLRATTGSGDVWDPDKKRSLAFLFSGQGAQYPNMGKGLYQSYPRLREQIDHAAAVLRQSLGFDLRELLYPAAGEEREAARRLEDTAVAQVALFVVEYAVARLLMSWGIQPAALAGHSVGEYVAATLAGVFAPDDALRLVAERGRLMSALPRGVMLAVPLSAEALAKHLEVGLAVAVANAPDRCVVSGPMPLIEVLAERLRSEGVEARRLHTSHAFHSPMMQGAVEPFAELLSQVELSPPTLPFLSNLTGTWISDDEARDPGYWARHLRQTVLFSDNLTELLADENRILLELGPGEMLTRLARRHPAAGPGHRFLSLLGRPDSRRDDLEVFLNGLGRLWAAGPVPDWKSYYAGEERRRLPLPGYAFDRKRYWIEPRAPRETRQAPALVKRENVEDWLYEQVWQRTARPRPDLETSRSWLIFAAPDALAEALLERLAQSGQKVVLVLPGSGFAPTERGYTLAPGHPDDYRRLFEALRSGDLLPEKILHLGLLGDVDGFEAAQEMGLFSLLHLANALEEAAPGRPADVLVVTRETVAVTGAEPICPDKATVAGALPVMVQERPHLACRLLDVGPDRDPAKSILDAAFESGQPALALRGGQLWAPRFRPLESTAGQPKLRQEGVYLITGGLEEIGVEQAAHLVTECSARLALQVEAGFPAEEDWDSFLASHEKHRVRSMILAARELQRQGGNLLLLPADEDDAAAMAGLPGRVEAHFGALHGFIHNGRLTGERSFRTLAETGVRECEWQLKPKVRGLCHLAPALAERELDFCLLNSSIGALLGGFGTFAYAAANSFLDAFAQEMSRRGRGLWIAVNWEAWQRTQIAGLSQDLAAFALSGEEGARVLERILHDDSPARVVVSTVPLKERLEVWARRGHFSTERPQETHGTRHARPDLETAYQPPATDTERLVAETWERILGLERVGVLDSFFELGGDSLTAVQTAAQLEKILGHRVPVVDLYDGLTVQSVAAAIDGLEGRPAPKEKTPDTARQSRRSRGRELQQQQRNRRGSRHPHPSS